jgi:two-component system chemotaxis sensor kinase CheA
MSQFHQVFFDETDEHLATMEGVLLAVDVAAPDSEDLNAIFRAAHSIKGGAATFGFGDLAALTHVLENLLDKVRKGTMPLSTAMVDVCLQAKDVLAAMLAAHRGAAPVDPASVRAAEQQLTALVSQDAAVFAPAASIVPAVRASTQPAASSTMYIELDHLPEPDYKALLQSMALLGEMNLVQQGSDAPPAVGAGIDQYPSRR